MAAVDVFPEEDSVALPKRIVVIAGLGQIEQDEALQAPEIRYLVEFIRSSQRGVILRRATRRAEEMVADE